jgi:hypothetical protein
LPFDVLFLTFDVLFLTFTLAVVTLCVLKQIKSHFRITKCHFTSHHPQNMIRAELKEVYGEGEVTGLIVPRSLVRILAYMSMHFTCSILCGS